MIFIFMCCFFTGGHNYLIASVYLDNSDYTTQFQVLLMSILLLKS